MILKKVNNSANSIFVERASIRKYDTSVKISREEMANILQDAMTAPSSLNLQPWRFFVFESAEGKDFLKPFVAFNMQQCETSSAVIAVYGDMDAADNADKILSANVENNLMTEEYKTKMMGFISSIREMYTEEQLKNSVMLDCGFVTMQLMLAAKAYGYDTNVIGGYQREQLTQALELDPKRYIPVVLVSIGKAAEEKHDTIRFSAEELTQWK